MPFLGKDENSDWVRATYPFAGSSLDKSLPPHQCSGPFVLSGIDGREFGSLLRWPGFIRHVIGDMPIPGDPAPKYIARINLNKGSEGHELRGYVILRRHVLFSYYDSELRAWYAKILRYNFGGLQLNSDSFRATGSNVAMYLSWCGQTRGTARAASGQRRIAVEKAAFFKAGDTIWIERDTSRAEEAVVDSVSAHDEEGVAGDITLRTNLRYTHGDSNPLFWIEGGSGDVGMTVVTHDGEDFLIEQAGPLYEDNEIEFEVNMIGGTTTPPPTTTTTTPDVTTGAPVINTPVRDGDSSFSGHVAAGDPTGPTGVTLEMQRDKGDGVWGTISLVNQGKAFTSNEDGTWTRQTLPRATKESYRYRVRSRLPDVGDGTPGPWTNGEPTTCLAALPEQASYSSLCAIESPLYGGDQGILITLPASATTTAVAQILIRSTDGNSWLTYTNQKNASDCARWGKQFILPTGAGGLAAERTYTVRTKDFSAAEWSGTLDDSDGGRLLGISVKAGKAFSMLASINEPVTAGDAKINGFILDGGSQTVGQIVKWNGERWHVIGTTQSTGQYGHATFEFNLPSSVVTGDIVSVRTRLVNDGPWSGDLTGAYVDDDNRLMTIAVVVK